jgi:hypothetical protein
MASERRLNQLEEKCFQLVGEFMGQWALLESAIDDGISEISRMGAIENIALRTQLSFQNKIDLLQYLIVTFTQESKDKQERKDLCSRIRAISTIRNTIVHSLFWSNDDGSINFSKSQKSKGEFKIDKKVISEREFYDIFDQIDREIDLINRKSAESAIFRKTLESELKPAWSFTIPVERMEDASQSGLGALLQFIAQSEQSERI